MKKLQRRLILASCLLYLLCVLLLMVLKLAAPNLVKQGIVELFIGPIITIIAAWIIVFLFILIGRFIKR